MTATETPPGVFVPTEAPKLVPMVRYSVTEAMIAKYREDFGKLIITDTKTEQAVRSALTVMVKTRTGIEAEYKSLTADAQERINLIRSEKKRILGELAPTEEHLQAEWDRAQAARAKKKADEEAAKAKVLQDRIDAENAARKAELDRQAAELAAEKARQEEENRIAREALAESRRKLEEQQAAAKAKADEEARIARERDEAARKERERIEAERQAAERVRFEAEQKADRERLAKVEAEQRAERERLAKLKAKLKAEIDAKELAERLAKEAEEKRVADMERAAALKAREEALRPDKEKIATWAFNLRKLQPPKVSDAEAAVVVGESMAAIRNAAAELEVFAGVEGKVAS